MEPEKRIKDRTHHDHENFGVSSSPDLGLLPLFASVRSAPNSFGLWGPHMSDQTVPDAPTADYSGGREWTQRLLIFASVCVIAEIAWLTALAWATLSLARWLFF